MSSSCSGVSAFRGMLVEDWKEEALGMDVQGEEACGVCIKEARSGGALLVSIIEYLDNYRGLS